VVGDPPQRVLQPAWHADGEARERGERFAALAVEALCGHGAWRQRSDASPRTAPLPRPGSFA
jgi:hypothetical protein